MKHLDSGESWGGRMDLGRCHQLCQDNSSCTAYQYNGNPNPNADPDPNPPLGGCWIHTSLAVAGGTGNVTSACYIKHQTGSTSSCRRPVAAGEFLFVTPGRSCMPRRCINAKPGRYYTGAGSASLSASTAGDCATKECSSTRLRPGTFWVKGWANTSDCGKLYRTCPEPAAGFRFKAPGTCDIVRCPSIAGKYYHASNTSRCASKSCTNTPPPGMQFILNWTDRSDACPIAQCDPPASGKRFTQGCDTIKCSNAPVGNYYLSHGGAENKCPFAPCANATLGHQYTGQWSTQKDSCQTVKCNTDVPHGYAYSTPGSCDLRQCTAPPRGMYYTESCVMGCDKCDVGDCTNRPTPTVTYHGIDFTNVSDQCPMQACEESPPAGLRFTRESGCDITKCTNADPGFFYTKSDSKTYTRQSRSCPTARCNAPPAGRYFLKGFATHPDACPTAMCDMDALPRGHYYGPRCKELPCDNPPGYYYLLAATRGQQMCAHVRSKCTNAQRGEMYVQSTNIVSAADGCKVADCPRPPTGKYFAIPDDCSTMLPCTGAPAGQNYSSHGGNSVNKCPVTDCTNARRGQYYKSRCTTAQCYTVPGYRFTTQPTAAHNHDACSKVTPCTTAKAGQYYVGGGELCATEPCIKRRGDTDQWRYVAGFALRKDWCPKVKCPQEPPYVESQDSCDPASTATSPGINTNFGEVSDTSAQDDTMLVTAIAVAVPVVVVVLVALAVVVVCCAKARDGKTPARKAVPSTIASLQEGDVGGHVAKEVSGNVRAVDFLLNDSDVKMGRKLAHGASGQIFEGTFSDHPVALKESYDVMMNDQDDEMVREAAMMIKLRHHNIVQFFGIWHPSTEISSDDSSRVFLVMELCSNGDLHEAARDPDSTLANRQKWIAQVASAMQYLHSRNPPIIHRDLKPQNVLLDKKLDAKVCDFGISKIEEKSRDMTLGIGTVAYMAPELMDMGSAEKVHMDGTKCDVFSFAILALYVATACAPYKGLNNDQIVLMVMANQRMEVPEAYVGVDTQDRAASQYDLFTSLVNRMWDQDPSERPPFETIIHTLNQIFQTPNSCTTGS